MQSFSKTFSVRSPYSPGSQLISQPLTMTQKLQMKGQNLSSSQERLLKEVPMLEGAHQSPSLRGSRPVPHTCPGPRKAQSLGFQPSSQSSREFTVTGCRQPENWPRKEALQPCTCPWPHPKGTSRAVILHGTASSQKEVRCCCSLGPQTLASSQSQGYGRPQPPSSTRPA